MHITIRQIQGILCSLGILVMLSACSVGVSSQQTESLGPPVETESVPEADVPPTVAEPTQETDQTTGQPALRSDLTRDCQKGERSLSGPWVGNPAIEFTLMDVNGDFYTLSELLQEKPVVMIFGSFT